MYSTRIFSDIVECLSHRNAAVRNKAEKMSDIGKEDKLISSPFLLTALFAPFSCTVLEYDRKDDGELGTLAKTIVKKRFENYNKVWLQTVFFNGADGLGTGASSQAGAGVNHLYYAQDGPGGVMHDTSYDRLPTSQEHEIDMTSSAKYFNEKVIFVFALCS